MKEMTNNIKILLLKNGNTFNDLANIIGCKSVTTAKLKTAGKRKWYREEMIKIRDHYSLSNEELISIFFK